MHTSTSFGFNIAVLFFVALPKAVPITINSPKSSARRVQRIHSTAQNAPQNVVQISPEPVKFAQDQVRAMQEELILEMAISPKAIGQSARWSRLPSIKPHNFTGCTSCLDQFTGPIYPSLLSLVPKALPSEWSSHGKAGDYDSHYYYPPALDLGEDHPGAIAPPRDNDVPEPELESSGKDVWDELQANYAHHAQADYAAAAKAYKEAAAELAAFFLEAQAGKQPLKLKPAVKRSPSPSRDDWVPIGSALVSQIHKDMLVRIGTPQVEAQKAAILHRAKVEKLLRVKPKRVKPRRSSPSRVLLVSATTHIRPWTFNVSKNQDQWTSMHRSLNYEFLSEDKTAGLLKDGFAPQWLKIRVLQDQLRNALLNNSYDFILWIDDDIVITSARNFVEDMVDKMGPEHHMLIARDAGDPDSGVNSGMMLFRTSHQASLLLDQIWKMSSHIVWKSRRTSLKVTLGTCKNQECLHEQEGINLLRSKNRKFKSSVKVVPPVDEDLNMNTFWRETHFDDTRRKWIEYDKDPEEYMWDETKEMNTCHVTGMVEHLRTAYIDDCIIAAQRAFKRKA
eukprot:gnl/MRDRNA2_/MRDRNA2_129807_c0_seq1.p1 gnl/MRDRNA2_/MRDRNA2_129807_c0~~gnl/MRDRNA2_/MRDRNA2_129807_c0_seq1.p1  ORF type:complete len:563 (-),score=107.43 gnl/MRDRNA2_/MRDRNA2_129807_c0_seq1:327-2015(-)